MIVLEIDSVKEFMQHMFQGSMFDRFHLRSCEATTFATFHIDGRCFDDWFDSDEKRTDETGLVTWNMMKTFVFSWIKGCLLYTSLGTFRPVKVDDVSKHHMHTEFYQVTKEEADRINKAKQAGGRIVCVGTTSCRTIESAADENGVLKPGQGDTDIFIYPGYSFKMMDVLITNFHLPESTLLMLVSALAGKEQVMRVYEEAVRERYRFFSFGDAMIILDD